MAKLGKKSLKELSSCHIDHQLIFATVVKYFDISVIEGSRTAETQNKHWSKGRMLKEFGLDPKVRDNWVVVDKSKIVTQKDGYEKKSRHQSFPSVAVDVVPYPSMWADKEEFTKLIAVVDFVQNMLYDDGVISHKIENGYTIWGWDRPHWQIVK